MFRLTAAILFTALVSAPLHAGDVVFQGFGTVSSASAPSGPFVGTSSGQLVHVTFQVFTPGTDVTPGQYTNYAIDTSTLQVEIGANVDGALAGPSPVVGMVNAYPLADGIHMTGVQLAGGNRLDFEFSNGTGTAFTSTDPLQNLVTLTGPFYSSYNFVVYGAGAYIDIALTSFSISLPLPGQSFCFGDGSLTDHTTPCPCGNNGAPGNGCGHSFDPNGAHLGASGKVSDDTVLLSSSFEPSTSFTLFMQHDATGDFVFHDGVLCAGGNLIRLRGRSAIGGAATFPNPTWDSSITLSQRGGVFPGQGVPRYYAAWYRNASTTFCPPATANVTNGWRIDW